MNGQQLRWTWRLTEVEVRGEVPKAACALAHVWSRVRASVGTRIEAPAFQEVILDELQVRIETQGLMIDVTSAPRRG